MLIPVLLFAAGLVLLIKGGDWFVDAATGIAQRFHIPELLIGATIVSIGTTLPEVMVSATSALSGHSEIAYGNAVGSVICNTALISAITISAAPAPVDRKAFRTPVIFFFATAVFYILVSLVTGEFSRTSGLILLGIFLLYTFVCIKQAAGQPVEDSAAEEEEEKEEEPLLKQLFMLVFSAALIAIGANLLVNNGTIIARALGVAESVIALTMVALGTSLPELCTAITSLMKGHGALSLGNIIGANLFNLALVTGVSASLCPFDVPVSRTLFGMNASFVVDLPVMLGVMMLMTIPPLIKGRLYRIQGVILLAIYVSFCAFQFLV